MQSETKNLSELQKLAIEIYTNSVKVPEWREKFIKDINSGTEVIDKRNEGHYCSYCKRFAKNTVAFDKKHIVIYVNNGFFDKGPKQIWLIHSHYDGCRGWE